MKKLFLFFLGILVFSGCSDNNEKNIEDNFDRRAMLSDWADLIIIPAYTEYLGKLEKMQTSFALFEEEVNMENYTALQNAYIDAYKTWQYLSMFEIGKAEEIGLRNYTNIYPCNPELIHDNIEASEVNLSLPSNFVAQGFPAIDYMLYGIEVEASDILEIYDSGSYLNYLKSIIDRLVDLTREVHEDWTTGYREDFITNDNSSATASTDKLINDFVFYYEKFFRAGKVGIPAGVFSGSSIPGAIEAPYSEIYSKELFKESLTAVRNFFSGVGFDKSVSGISLKDYLMHTAGINNTSEIATQITDQWEVVEAKSDEIEDSFKNILSSDHLLMLELYDELQKAVVLLKVDMMSALNVQVDYVDADGD